MIEKRTITVRGALYRVSRSGRYAWPAKPEKAPPPGMSAREYADINGQTVDRDLPRDSQAVRGAGPMWAEVYEELKRLESTHA